MKITKIATTLLLGGVATAVMMGQANALEAQAFVDRFAALFESQSITLEFGEASLDGDTITVSGVKGATADASGDKRSFAIEGDLVFSGVAETADGGFTAASLAIPDVDYDFEAEPVGNVSIVDIRIDSIYLPPEGGVTAISSLQWAQSFSTGELTLSMADDEIAHIESIESSSEFNPEQTSASLVDLTSTFSVNGITTDLSSASEADASALAVMEALGLTKTSGSITGSMSWSMADGHFDFDSMLVDFADVGAIDIAFEATGLTPAVLDQISAMQETMGATPTAEQQQAQMMQSMAIMQGVSIVGASVRYDDASLAGKLLDFFAAQSGADRAGFVEGLKAMLPAVIAESGIPALNDVVVPPVSAFLDDPQSLEIKIAPPSPTSILVVMAAAANPAGLITALGLAVEANTAAAE